MAQYCRYCLHMVVLQTPQTYGKSINPNTEIISDLISRQAVIDAVREAQEWFGAKETSEDCFAFEACEEIIDAINKIPYADMRGGDNEAD